MIYDIELKWIRQQWIVLCKHYAGEWIAVNGQGVIGHGDSILQAIEQAQDKEYTAYYLTRIPNAWKIPLKQHWVG